MLKKTFLILLITSILIPNIVYAQELSLYLNNPKIIINGVQSKIDTPPKIINDSTIVPLKAISEAFGFKTEWNQKLKQIKITSSNQSLILIINSKIAILNGIPKQMDTAPIIMNGKTMVPVRFISEVFKKDVNWIKSEKKIVIKDKSSVSNANFVIHTAKTALKPTPKQTTTPKYLKVPKSIEELKQILKDTINTKAEFFTLLSSSSFLKIILNKNEVVNYDDLVDYIREINREFCFANGYYAILKTIEGNTYVKYPFEYISLDNTKRLDIKGNIILTNSINFIDLFEEDILKNKKKITIKNFTKTSSSALFQDLYDVGYETASFNKSSYKIYLSGDDISLNVLNSEDVKLKTQELGDESRKIVDKIITVNMADRDKIKAIHDYIINNTRYDKENYDRKTIPDISYNAYGILVKGVGVCAGYAGAFNRLAKMAGIESIIVGGGGETSPHAWNAVKLEGKIYYIDCTWDDPTTTSGENVLRYNYYLIDKEVMKNDHTWDDSKDEMLFEKYK